MTPRLALPRSAVNGLLAAAQETPGVEVCGFLVRRDGRCVVRPVGNVAATPEVRFEMDPRGLLAAFRAAREADEEILAIYHSHPAGPAEPSALDRRLAYYPELPYLVISLGTRGVLELRAFSLAGDACAELELVLDGAPQ